MQYIVPAEAAGMRLDAFLAQQLIVHSRVRLRQAIVAGDVLVEGVRVKPSFRVQPGTAGGGAPEPELPREAPRPEPIPLEILYEDDDLIALNKPAGMVVHPARGNWSGTLANALSWHFHQLSTLSGPLRPGIVHRLDRETSGVLVVAKHDLAHLQLTRQFSGRSVEKTYWAIVTGVPDRDRDTIDQPIGQHPYQREKMAIRSQHPSSRPARTFYHVLERFNGYSLLEVKPYTGRTHQIRVHLDHAGTPVLCDRLYGGRSRITVGELVGSDDPTVILERHALHALRLRLRHPRTGEGMELEAPLPEDMKRVLDLLRQAARGGGKGRAAR